MQVKLYLGQNEGCSPGDSTSNTSENCSKYHILMHIDAGIENRLQDTVGEGEGGMNSESNPETYTLPYVT